MEGGVIEMYRLVEDVGCCLTARAAHDIARWQIAIDAIFSADGTAGDGDGGLTTTQESLAISAHAIPQVALDCLAVAALVAELRVVVVATGIVALAHGSHEATAIDIARHMTATHGEVGVAIDLAGGDAVDFAGNKRIGLEIFQLVILNRDIVLVFTLTTGIDAHADKTASNIDLGILIDVTILATAIDGTEDVRRTKCRRGAVVDVYFRLTHISTESFLVAFHSLTHAAAIDVALHVFFERSSDMTTSDGDGCLAAFLFRIRLVRHILKLVRPTQGKTLSKIGMLDNRLIRISCTVDGEWAISIFFHTIVDDAHAGQLAAAIDILRYCAARDADRGVATHHACPLHRRIDIVHLATIPLHSDRCRMLMVIAAIAAAEDIAADGTIGNGDGSILANGTELAAAIDVASDSAASDIDIRFLRLCQLRP